MDVNLDAALSLLREAHPLLRDAPARRPRRRQRLEERARSRAGRGRVLGSKAALTQLARVAALEWGADGIRVNVVHPNAVFDTGVWSDEVIDEPGRQLRAHRRGVPHATTCCGTEVTSADVARHDRRHVRRRLRPHDRRPGPVDGGNDRVI